MKQAKKPQSKHLKAIRYEPIKLKGKIYPLKITKSSYKRFSTALIYLKGEQEFLADPMSYLNQHDLLEALSRS